MLYMYLFHLLVKVKYCHNLTQTLWYGSRASLRCIQLWASEHVGTSSSVMAILAHDIFWWLLVDTVYVVLSYVGIPVFKNDL